ncbi:MAG: NfeD family protein [Promicromonosporaceae bacterium]|nr:NfeD family protein [Promicromonosporaceae bacterium]
MTTLFIAVGGVGLTLLLLSTLLGGVTDCVDSAFGAINCGVSSAAIGVALTVFGAAGFLAFDLTDRSWLALLIAVVCAFLLAAAAQWTISWVADTDLGRVNQNLVGSIGTVTTAIGETVGEVRLDDINEVETRLAHSSTPLPVGTRVVVREHNENRITVIPL